MDLKTLHNELTAALTGEPEATPDTDAETKPMTQEDFSSYVVDQIGKASEEEGEEARLRLSALLAEIETVSKFEYKGGELPSVRIFKDPMQHSTTDSPGHSPKAQSAVPNAGGFVAKMDEVSKSISEALGGSDGPAAGSDEPNPEEQGDSGLATPDATVWPEDLTDLTKKAPRDGEDYWGDDPAE